MNSLLAEFILDSPVNIVKTTTVASFKITEISIRLFDTCRISVSLFDDQGQPFENRVLYMTPEDYAAWGTDDSYIVHWITQRIA